MLTLTPDMTSEMQEARTRVRIGQATSCGPKERNDDLYGATIPDGAPLALKGMVFAISDGISSSDFGQIASHTAIKSLMSDYYATPDAWSAKTSVSRVLNATNRWLHALSSFKGISNPDHGYVCTLAVVVFKGQAAHVFNIGDSRIWRLSGTSLELLTRDHSAVLGNGERVLARALGIDTSVEIDYRKELLVPGDTYVFTTDGLHGFWDVEDAGRKIFAADDLDAVAAEIVDDVMAAGSDDNASLQIVRLEALAPLKELAFADEFEAVPFATPPREGDVVDGIRLEREIHSNHRSRILLGILESGQKVAFKLPANEILNDEQALKRFMIEEWIARRLDNPNVLSAPKQERSRSGLYILTNYVDGQTLRQWMHDNPDRSFEQSRIILEQVIKGLRALHRREMLHQDLRPENILVSPDMKVTLIDFGSAYVSGVQEAGPFDDAPEIMGTVQYTAPEYYTHEPVSWRSDQFSLGVIAYELFTGALPYGVKVSQLRKPADRKRLKYARAENDNFAIPEWLDHALRRSVHPVAGQRFDALSEFDQALRSPSVDFRPMNTRPLMERAPRQFWQGLSLLLALICLVQAIFLIRIFQ